MHSNSKKFHTQGPKRKKSSYVIINAAQMIWDVFLGNILLKEK